MKVTASTTPAHRRWAPRPTPRDERPAGPRPTPSVRGGTARAIASSRRSPSGAPSATSTAPLARAAVASSNRNAGSTESQRPSPTRRRAARSTRAQPRELRRSPPSMFGSGAASVQSPARRNLAATPSPVPTVARAGVEVVSIAPTIRSSRSSLNRPERLPRGAPSVGMRTVVVPPQKRATQGGKMPETGATAYVCGTFDTKGAELHYLAGLLRAAGVAYADGRPRHAGARASVSTWRPPRSQPLTRTASTPCSAAMIAVPPSPPWRRRSRAGSPAGRMSAA